MADDIDLDDDERELIARRREARNRDNFTARIRDDKGNEFEGPYSKLRGWVQSTFGIDLDDEPAQDEPEPKGKGKPKGDGGEVRRFAGRRIS